MTTSNTSVSILIVDDFRDNLEVFEAMLSFENVRVVTAESGQEALAILEDTEIALALIDVNMPGMDGFALAHRVRSSERGRQIPIIFVTAGSDQRLVIDAYAMGAVDFLLKPIDARILRSKVEVLVQLYRQRRQLAEQLEQDRELMRVTQLFMAAIGHDLRSPLQTVVTGTSLLLRTMVDEQGKSVTQRIQSAGFRMSRLINDLMDFCQMRLTASFSVSPAQMNILETVVKVTEELRLGGATVPLHLTHDGSFNVTWDETRIAQVLTNLIVNAVNHGDSHGVSIAIHGQDPDSITIIVRNGGTINPELLPHIFEPFHTTSKSPRNNSGLGLGLYIIAQIVRAHCGTIVVSSDNTAGTTFLLRIPRHASSRERLPQALGQGFSSR